MRVVKASGTDRAVPRGVVGGSEISQATAGASNIYVRDLTNGQTSLVSATPAGRPG